MSEEEETEQVEKDRLPLGAEVICVRPGHKWHGNVGKVAGANSASYGVTFYTDSQPPPSGRWMKAQYYVLLKDRPDDVDPVYPPEEREEHLSLEYHGEPKNGGNASVWKAYDQTHQRWVAVRIPFTGIPDEALSHARFSGRVGSHANIVAVHHCGKIVDPTNEQRYVTGTIMDWVEGCTLREYLEAGINVDQAKTLAQELVRGVQHIHESGVAHSDLHKKNILVENGHIRIIDLANSRSVRMVLEGKKIEPLDDVDDVREICVEIIEASNADASTIEDVRNAVRGSLTLDEIGDRVGELLEPRELTDSKREALLTFLSTLDADYPVVSADGDSGTLDVNGIQLDISVKWLDSVELGEIHRLFAEHYDEYRNEQGRVKVLLFVASDPSVAPMLSYALNYPPVRRMTKTIGYVVTQKEPLGVHTLSRGAVRLPLQIVPYVRRL